MTQDDLKQISALLKQNLVTSEKRVMIHIRTEIKASEVRLKGEIKDSEGKLRQEIKDSERNIITETASFIDESIIPALDDLASKEGLDKLTTRVDKIERVPVVAHVLRGK